ncbi:Rid family detoxifying hydrolase [Photobacterium chitinilyticum]|uniref:RidA family protein n=1 Tax=Photobacterium chitinilyticum TaxID=2485123 RepID=UPI003D113187
MKVIQTQNKLIPAGHYSQAIEHNGMVYISGQLPINPDTGEQVHGDIAEQARTVLNNIKLILETANSSVNNVLKVSVFIPDIALWDKVNEVYAEFFGDHKPARCVVPTSKLHFDFKLEIECVAFMNEEPEHAPSLAG